MFKLDDNFSENNLSTTLEHIKRNYVIQINDLLTLNVYTNKGERIVDPNFELSQNMRQNAQSQQPNEYLVQIDSTIKFPVIKQFSIAGLTLNNAEALLQKKYDEYYKDSFVKLQYQNKRVIVLGAVGGQMIPLTNDNISVIEILALAGGVEMGGKAQNIKIIRGDLTSPKVFQIDLSTISGMSASMLKVEPGDIIYVEPWRRPWREGLKDAGPILSLLSSTIALILVLQNLNP
jgi:polysaccharide export outer membrane protein